MLTSVYVPSQQAGNGIKVAFDFAFKILATTDLVVSKLDASGNSTPLYITTDYTVTFDPIKETGTVTFVVAPVNGGFAVIERSSDETQQSNLPREGPAPAKTTETMIDKCMMLIQELLQGSTETPLEQSGLYADKPVGSTVALYYYSTDRQSYEKWVPDAGRWFLLG